MAPFPCVDVVTFPHAPPLLLSVRWHAAWRVAQVCVRHLCCAHREIVLRKCPPREAEPAFVPCRESSACPVGRGPVESKHVQPELEGDVILGKGADGIGCFRAIFS